MFFFGSGVKKKEKHLKKEKHQEASLKSEWRIYIKVGNLIAKLEFKGRSIILTHIYIGGVFGSGKAEEFELKGRGSYHCGYRYTSWKK